MTHPTPDWDEYIAYRHGLFRARIAVEAFRPDGSAGFDPAEIEITAAAGEEEGVTISFHDELGRSESVWFTTADGGAEACAAAFAATSTRDETSLVELPAWTKADPPEPVSVEIATPPDAFDRVYLDIGSEDNPAAVLLEAPDAAAAAQAIRAAIAYLADHDAE
jgi:hypothetical protein